LRFDIQGKATNVGKWDEQQPSSNWLGRNSVALGKPITHSPSSNAETALFGTYAREQKNGWRFSNQSLEVKT
jgi:hypothetical protein